ncbi:MAG: hypothetical protein B7Z08_02975 [Sphingomonadales bacterium 32-68-7]|nr:MAG: hypothetical protein B7Z08_02975 [Sphingomonadales bacterium 32-68-7]
MRSTGGRASEAAMHQMRAATLTGYIEVAHAAGLDGERMLRESGILPSTLLDPENRLPAEAVVRLFERSAELSGDESFGLLMAEARSFASLGPLSLLLERLANVRAMMVAAIEMQTLLNDILTMALEEDGEPVLIRFDLVPGFWSVQMFDHVVAMAYRTLTAASGHRWRPEYVHLMRQAPVDPVPWRRVFGNAIEFGAAFNGMSSPRADMLLPNPHADETMAQHARRLLKLVPARSAEETVGERVRREIGVLLPSGRATLGQVAQRLGQSPRSLQRHLDADGEPFGTLLDDVRQQLAQAYLGETDRPITAIAALLGYATPSSFTRWFARAFGMSPQAWRAQRRAQGSGPPALWRR